MIIALNTLSAEALHGIIETFILREGTDYGEIEISLGEKITQVKQQLVLGNLVIVYSELHQTVNIMAKEQFSNDAPEPSA